MCIKPRILIHLTNGRATGTSGAIILSQRATSRLTSWGLTISMNMEPGATRQNTDRCGLRALMLVGRHIPPVTGFGKIHGAGLGLITSLGDSLRFTMADGFMPAASGDGLRARFMFVRTMPLHWSRGSVAVGGESALASAAASAAASDGAR